MKTILKYPAPVEDKFTIDLPIDEDADTDYIGTYQINDFVGHLFEVN